MGTYIYIYIYICIYIYRRPASPHSVPRARPIAEGIFWPKLSENSVRKSVGTTVFDDSREAAALPLWIPVTLSACIFFLFLLSSLELRIQPSMSLKYEPSSEQLHISAPGSLPPICALRSHMETDLI